MEKEIEINFSMSAMPDVKNEEEAKEETIILLEHITKQIRDGCTSGYNPTWDLTITA